MVDGILFAKDQRNMNHSKLTLALVAALLSFTFTPASAYDFQVDGIYYNIISASELTCAVTSGENKYTGEIVIPNTVTYKGRKLSVNSIEDNSFDGCTGVNKLVIEDGNATLQLGTTVEERLGVKRIFKDCNIEFLYVGRNLSYTYKETVSDSYRMGPFTSGKLLQTVIIGDSVTTISPYEFGCCKGLTIVIIPNSVTTIELGAFQDCYSLASVTLPNSVTTIGQCAFGYCI